MNRHLPENYKVLYKVDQVGRLIQEIHPCGLSISYTYNSRGLYQSVVYSPNLFFNSIMDECYILEYDSNDDLEKSTSKSREVTTKPTLKVKGKGGLNMFPAILTKSLTLNTDVYGRPSLYNFQDGTKAIVIYSPQGVQYCYQSFIHVEPSLYTPIALRDNIGWTLTVESFLDSLTEKVQSSDVTLYFNRDILLGGRVGLKSFYWELDEQGRIIRMHYSDLGVYQYFYVNNHISRAETPFGVINYDSGIATNSQGQAVVSPLPHITNNSTGVESHYDVFGRIISVKALVSQLQLTYNSSQVVRHQTIGLVHDLRFLSNFEFRVFQVTKNSIPLKQKAVDSVFLSLILIWILIIKTAVIIYLLN